jgi:hypothetical protein
MKPTLAIQPTFRSCGLFGFAKPISDLNCFGFLYNRNWFSCRMNQWYNVYPHRASERVLGWVPWTCRGTGAPPSWLHLKKLIYTIFWQHRVITSLTQALCATFGMDSSLWGSSIPSHWRVLVEVTGSFLSMIRNQKKKKKCAPTRFWTRDLPENKKKITKNMCSHPVLNPGPPRKQKKKIKKMLPPGFEPGTSMYTNQAP